MTLHFNGHKDPDRRAAVERGEWAIDDSELSVHRGNGIGLIYVPEVKAYRKITLTYAFQIDQPFEVETLEGLHTGKAGDYLAIGPHGEMYPIDAAVFDASYELAE